MYHSSDLCSRNKFSVLRIKYHLTVVYKQNLLKQDFFDRVYKIFFSKYY